MRTFGNIPEQYAGFDDSEIVILPVPYDETCHWVNGADRGPAAFLAASRRMELYDIETKSQVYLRGIHVDNPIADRKAPESLVQVVRQRIEQLMNSDKFVVLIGGEASVSIGSIQAQKAKFQDLTVLHLGAHANLLQESEGSKFHRRCSMHWANENCNLIQIGTRSLAIGEYERLDRSKYHFAKDIVPAGDDWMEEVVDQCTSKVYVSIDLDVFDPSICPSVSLPQPGGLRWYQVLRLCNMIMNRRDLVGFDIVGLHPNPEDKSTDALAAKLCYKILSYQFS